MGESSTGSLITQIMLTGSRARRTGPNRTSDPFGSRRVDRALALYRRLATLTWGSTAAVLAAPAADIRRYHRLAKRLELELDTMTARERRLYYVGVRKENQ
jgi:hypothetical protein